jgi:hypothetical protein
VTCSIGGALRLFPAVHAAAPSLDPGPRGAALLWSLFPSRPVIPVPPTPKLGGRSMARALVLERANAAPHRYVEVTTLAASLVTTGRSPCEGPPICRAIVGGGAARCQPATALEATLDGGSALNLRSAPWPG